MVHRDISVQKCSNETTLTFKVYIKRESLKARTNEEDAEVVVVIWPSFCQKFFNEVF